MAGILSGIADLFNSGTNIASSIANYNLQKENYQYQKDLQQQIFAREDNSVQRRVNDLKEAGLSPVLAAGSSAGSGAVVNTSAPKMESPQISLDNMLSFAQLANEKQKIENDTQRVKNETAKIGFESSYYNAMTSNELAKNQGILFQNALTNNLALNAVADNKLKNQTLQNMIQEFENLKASNAGLILKNAHQSLENDILARDFEWAKFWKNPYNKDLFYNTPFSGFSDKSLFGRTAETFRKVNQSIANLNSYYDFIENW